MSTPIADAMTNIETRGLARMFESVLRKQDSQPDKHTLIEDVHTLAEYMENVAYDVPDDALWPEYGEVEAVNGAAA